MIHIALCFSDASGGYYKHALVTLASVFDNTRSEVRAHIIHDETVPETVKDVFVRLCERYGQSVVFYDAGEIPAGVEDNVSSVVGRGTLFRLMMQDILPVDKVLYLDCDIVCLRDVRDIYAHDVSGCYMGVVTPAPGGGRKHRERLRLRREVYVNCGVLLLNLRKLRDHIPDYAARLYTLIKEPRIRLADQDAINLFFDGMDDGFTYLPSECNFLVEHRDHAALPPGEYQGKVIHFAGKKPWDVFTTPGIYYWKYYAALFPEEDVFSRMERLLPYEHTYLFSFMLRHERLRRWLKRLSETESRGLWATLRTRLFPASRKPSGTP